MTTYTGGCTCGAVRYRIEAEPVRSFQCQCRDCQRDTGSGHASVMVFPRAAMQVTGESASLSSIVKYCALVLTPGTLASSCCMAATFSR